MKRKDILLLGAAMMQSMQTPPCENLVYSLRNTLPEEYLSYTPNSCRKLKKNTNRKPKKKYAKKSRKHQRQARRR